MEMKLQIVNSTVIMKTISTQINPLEMNHWRTHAMQQQSYRIFGWPKKDDLNHSSPFFQVFRIPWIAPYGMGQEQAMLHKKDPRPIPNNKSSSHYHPRKRKRAKKV